MIIILFQFCKVMRSLYVDDIPGAKPKRHYYDKALYRQRHQQQIYRHSKKNPEEKRKIQWYHPIKKVTQPLDKNDDNYWNTKRTLRKSFGLQPISLSKSMHVSQMRSSSLGNIEPQMTQSSVLSGTGRNSLAMSNPSNQNPYFPHRYIEKVVGEKNKWSGSRVWQEQATKVINLPSVENSYFKKWS